VEGAQDSTRRKSLRDVQTCSLVFFYEENFPQRQRSSASGAPSTTVRSLRELQWSPSPASRGRKGEALSRRVSVRVLCPAKRDRRNPSPLIAFTLCFFLPSQKKKGGGTPANAGHQPPHLATRRAPCRVRSPDGVPPRLSPKGIIPSQRLSFRPGFLGGGLHGRYPPSPIPVQGSTSRPGHNAGGLMPKPPGSRLQIRPRAPHPLHLSACLRKASFERAG
jgi:hypothetical protein